MTGIGKPYPLGAKDWVDAQVDVAEGEGAVTEAMDEAIDAFKENIQEGTDAIKHLISHSSFAETIPELGQEALDLLIERAKELGALEMMRRTVISLARGEPIELQTGVPGRGD